MTDQVLKFRQAIDQVAGRELAMLGNIVVGIVMPLDSKEPSGKAQWIHLLPDRNGIHIALWQQVRNVDIAKDRLNQHVAKWLHDASLSPVGRQGMVTA